jgi:hypothetical protein
MSQALFGDRAEEPVLFRNWPGWPNHSVVQLLRQAEGEGAWLFPSFKR